MEFCLASPLDFLTVVLDRDQLMQTGVNMLSLSVLVSLNHSIWQRNKKFYNYQIICKRPCCTCDSRNWWGRRNMMLGSLPWSPHFWGMITSRFCGFSGIICYFCGNFCGGKLKVGTFLLCGLDSDVWRQGRCVAVWQLEHVIGEIDPSNFMRGGSSIWSFWGVWT